MATTSEILVEMDRKLYNMAVTGDVQSFLNARDIESGSEEYFLKQTFPQRNNILHLAIRHFKHEFIKAAVLEGFLSRAAIDKLICQGNCESNTPLHVAAEVGHTDICKLLLQQTADTAEPWTLQNADGNTPLHVAVIHGNIEFAALMVERHPHLARATNNSLETPLHIATYRDIGIVKEGEATSLYLGLIKLLVEKESCVTCWRDENGFTPLHRAASITSYYNLKIIRLMLEHCPESAEVRDSSGKTILHHLRWIPSYEEGKELLDVPVIYAIKDYQDHQGNTPLHMAVRNQNLKLVQYLLRFPAKLNIKNKDGISALDLIEEEMQTSMNKREMTLEECRALDAGNIPYLDNRLQKLGMNFLGSRDSKWRNILHKLMHIHRGTLIKQTEFVSFIEQVLGMFPYLVCQKDLNGDTPIHILVRNHFDTMIRFPTSNMQQKDCNLSPLSTLDLLPKLLELCYSSIMSERREAGAGDLQDYEYDWPWLMQNEDGNTPLHEALIANSDPRVLKRLLDMDIQITANLLNKRNQTPLHLLAGRSSGLEPLESKVIKSLVNANEGAPFLLDDDTLTPFLKAVKVGNLATITTLNELSPEATIMEDANGQTLWHLLVNQPEYLTWRLIRSSQQRNLKILLNIKDWEGKTPLHLAVECRQFKHAKYFLEYGSPLDEPEARQKWMREYLELETKAGVTSSDLIRSSPQVPDYFEQFMKDEPTMIGIRSVWEVPTTQMNEYANTMGVTAALLATITFTAAFTVPGGQIEDKGTPLLMKKAAFKIFLISDILAMCLSMMVLFCLLWVVACAEKGKAVVLMDFSIILLLLSFYATLVTFMAGLYATIFPVSPWIAIISLALCSLLMFLMDKRIVMDCMVPIGRSLLLFSQKILRYVRSPTLIYNFIKEHWRKTLLHGPSILQ